MKKIIYPFIIILLFISCRYEDNDDLIQEVFEAGYWFGQIDAMRNEYKIDTISYDLNQSLFENKEQKFFIGKSFVGKLIQNKIKKDVYGDKD